MHELTKMLVAQEGCASTKLAVDVVAEYIIHSSAVPYILHILHSLVGLSGYWFIRVN